MKILYVKSNSEREKAYQLQTIIYEEDNKKYVKKRALCADALVHLKRMKTLHDTLSSAIRRPDLKVARIISESVDSLTFEFIEGVSIEERILAALKGNDTATVHREIECYRELLANGFKTKVALPEGLKTAGGRQIFEGINLSSLGERRCFDGVSNIDLIFSNIIYREDVAYLIDYEWVFEGSVPVDFALYRALRSLHDFDRIDISRYLAEKERLLFDKMEKRLIYFEIMPPDSFYQYSERYKKTRKNLYEYVDSLKEEIVQLNHRLQQKEETIKSMKEEIDTLENEVVFYASSKSWKITRPMRIVMTQMRGTKQ